MNIKNENYLLKWGVLCISLSLIIIFFQGLFFEIEMPPVLGEKSSSVKFILLTAVLIFTVVPLIEETMFRGVLYRQLRSSTQKFGLLFSIITSDICDIHMRHIEHASFLANSCMFFNLRPVVHW